jgi:DNA-binding transcriptional regulator YiaG
MIVEPGAEKGTYWNAPQKAAQDERLQRAKELKGQGVTDEELAEALDMSDRTVRRWRQQGKLPDRGCPPDKKG